MTFPSTVAVKTLDQKHPEWVKNANLYEELRLLYVGGQELKQNAARFLARRPREIGSAFTYKLGSKLNYDPILSTVVSYYVSKMFEQGLEIEFNSGDSKKVDQFYTDFMQECDRGNTNLELFFTKFTEEMLVFRKAYFIIDLPKLPTPPSNLNEQKELGGLDPYLSHIDIRAVQNWQRDEYGNFVWVVVHDKTEKQTFLGDPLTIETWTYYDQQQFAKFSISYTSNDRRPEEAILVDSGPHAMSPLNTVPVICEETDQHWLGNRLYLSLIEHFNAYNSLAFSLWQALNPVPVLTDGDQQKVELTQNVSEFSFLHLPHGASATWLEPAGTSWDASQKYIEELRQNIYRMAHVSPLGRSTRATPASQSGYSKELEMSPSASVLNCIATQIKNVIQETLNAVAEIRGEKVVSDVRGFTFVQDTAASTIDISLAAQSLNIQSVTAKRELQKQVIRALFRNDANADLVQKMTDEIEAAPDDAFSPAPAGTGQQDSTVALNITERAGNPD